MNRARSGASILLAILLILVASPLFAQSDNTNVSGTITDPSGSAVPKAKVVITNQANDLNRETTTNESGNYSIPTVPPGMYTLTAEATGFKKFETRDNKEDPSVPANISAQLSVGQLSETIEVTATATQLQTESGALRKVVEGKQISDLQFNGRHPTFLALLKQGARGQFMGEL
jgi:hypothetical protein